jgi:hypothetical protein
MILINCCFVFFLEQTKQNMVNCKVRKCKIKFFIFHHEENVHFERIVLIFLW